MIALRAFSLSMNRRLREPDPHTSDQLKQDKFNETRINRISRGDRHFGGNERGECQARFVSWRLNIDAKEQ
ncbi:MAG: hypothetical protein Hens2KO_19060 [Henriciella sp.]